MGGKPKIQAPPPVDPEVQEKVDTSEAELAAEKKKAASLRMKGRGGTILTGGQGVGEEAATGKSVLSSY